MKIISKYKDYYDFLSGIYGEDPKLVLDRREFGANFLPITGDFKVILYITGNIIEGVCKDGKFYYGEDLFKIEAKDVNKQSNRYRKWFGEDDRYGIDYINVEIKTSLGKNEIIQVMLKSEKDISKYNIRLECPLLIKCDSYQRNMVSIEKSDIRFIKYPELSKLELGTFLSPNVIYQMILDWLSAQIDRRLNTTTELTNDQKLVNKGFDKKTSFRPKMK